MKYNLRYYWPLSLILLFMNIFPDNVFVMKLRGRLIRPFFGSCGRNLRIARGNIFYNSHRMIIGNDVFIGYGNWFNASDTITVEDEVLFGPKSIIVSGNHSRLSGSFRYGPNKNKPIRIKHGAWIGGNCSILAGCEVGRGSVVGANCVANSVIPDHVVFAGNPGKVVKTFDT